MQDSSHHWSQSPQRCAAGWLRWNERLCGNGSRREKAEPNKEIFFLFQDRYSTRWTHQEQTMTKHESYRHMDYIGSFLSLLSFLISVPQRRTVPAVAHSSDFYPTTDSSLLQEIVKKWNPIYTWTEMTAAPSGIRDYVVIWLRPIKNTWRSCFILFDRICKWETALYLDRWEFNLAHETNSSFLGRVTEQPSVSSFSVPYYCILLAVITTSKLHCILGEELCLSVYLMQQYKCSDKTIFRQKVWRGGSRSLLLITATYCWDNLKLSPEIEC